MHEVHVITCIIYDKEVYEANVPVTKLSSSFNGYYSVAHWNGRQAYTYYQLNIPRAHVFQVTRWIHMYKHANKINIILLVHKHA